MPKKIASVNAVSKGVTPTQTQVSSGQLPTPKSSANAEERSWAGQQRRQARRTERRANRQARRAAPTLHVMPTKANSGKAMASNQTQVSSDMGFAKATKGIPLPGSSSAASMVKQPAPMVQPRSPAAKRIAGGTKPAGGGSSSMSSIPNDIHKVGYTKL